MPVVGGRYLFFLKYDPATQGYNIQAYQLQAAKCITLMTKTIRKLAMNFDKPFGLKPQTWTNSLGGSCQSE
jgi:hypothetical protein